MPIIGGILDRLILVAGVIAGGTIPSFIAQYRQRIGGALDQALRDLAPFQEIANQRFNGSMQALLQHHLNSSDKTFHSEGAALATMVDSAQHLREAAQALNTDLLHQLLYLLKSADGKMLSATWAIFQPAFGLSMESLLLAAVVGVMIWVICVGIVWLPLRVLREIRGRMRYAHY
jgi:Protein of unknown function (DUF2937)